MFGKHILIWVVHSNNCFSLIQNKPSCNNTIGKKDDDEVDDNISDHAIAGMIAVGDVTAIHGVGPCEDTCKAERIKGYSKEAPQPDEEDDKINALTPEHHIIVLGMLGRVPYNTAPTAHLVSAHTQSNGPCSREY